MKYEDVIPGKPFYILHKDPKKQDITVWQKRDDGYGLVIFFHGENFWCNPPTDTNMEWRAQQAIEKYGVAYLPEDYVEGYKKTAWNEGNAYRQRIANEVLGVLA